MSRVQTSLAVVGDWGSDAEVLLLPGTQLGDRYLIGAVLGQGGCGTIYRAEHLGLGRAVAIKVPHAELDEHAQITARFRREVRISACVKHPNVPEVHDAGTLEDKRPFLVMELLEGTTLFERLAHGPLPEREAVRIMDEVLAALEALSAARVVHRDIKPSNIMLYREHPAGPERVKLIDFGVARTIEDDGKLTLLGTIIGTPDYMAPEQLAGSPVDERADLYACGVILYEMLTGKNPHAGSNYDERLRTALRGTPARPRLEGAHAGALSDVVLKPLSPRKADRFASAKEMREALRQALRDRPSFTLLLEALRRKPRAPVGVISLLVVMLMTSQRWFPAQLQEALALAPELGASGAPLVAASLAPLALPEPLAEPAPLVAPELTGIADAVHIDAPVAHTEPSNVSPQVAAPIYASRAHARALRALAVGDYGRAASELDVALTRQPNHAGALRAKVVLALAQHERRAAESAFANYRRFHPDAPDVAELRTWLSSTWPR